MFRNSKKVFLGAILAISLAATGNLPALAAPAELGPAVQVDANCGTTSTPESCTTSSLASSNTTRKIAVTSNGTIFALFYGPEGIRVAKSTDRGLTFAAAVQVSISNKEAELAVSSNDYLYVAWSEGTAVKFSKSTDLGTTWSTAIDVGTLSGSSTVHMAVDGEYIYMISRQGNRFFVSADAGQTFTLSSTSFGSWAYSDVLVDPLNHSVYAFVDNPSVSWFVSTDRGVTFSSATTTGKAVYYSVSAISTSTSQKFMYMAGSQGNLEKVDLLAASNTVSTLTVDPSGGQAQGRSLTADGYGNVVAGVVASGNNITFQVSNDFGSTFGSTQTLLSSGVSSKTWANVSINQTNGDLMFLYQNGDDIYFKTYTGYLVGYDLQLSVSSVNLGFAGEVKSLVLTNSGTTSLSLSNIGLSNNVFTFTSTCGATLAVGASCTISITGATAGEAVLEITANNGTSTVTRNVPVSLGALAAAGSLPQAGGNSQNQTSTTVSRSESTPTPLFDVYRGSFKAKVTMKLSGENLNLIESLKIGGVKAKIINKSATLIEFELEEDVPEGALIAEMGNSSHTGALFNLASVSSSTRLKTFTVKGFLPGSSMLNKSIRQAVKKAVLGLKSTEIVCTGYTSGPTVLKGDTALAKNRAKNVCDLAATLKPGLKTTVKVKNTTYADSKFRKTLITSN